MARTQLLDRDGRVHAALVPIVESFRGRHVVRVERPFGRYAGLSPARRRSRHRLLPRRSVAAIARSTATTAWQRVKPHGDRESIEWQIEERGPVM
jgi:hypothetical protein